MREAYVTGVAIALAGATLLSLAAGAADAVTGVVRSSRTDGSIVWLDLDDPEQTQVALIGGWLSTFPSTVSEAYVGQTITARGTTTRFRGRREIHIRDAEDITIISASVAATAPPANEVQDLRDQVRRLNERIDQLEHPAGP